MTSTIAGEGTNSDGREVTMTAQEREKTDAEMTGTTGKTRDTTRIQIKCHLTTSYPAKWRHFSNLEIDVCFIWVFISYFMLFPILTYPGSGTGAGNGATVESTEIMTEVVGRDSPRQGMTWVPNRNAWEETGEIRSNTNTWSLWLVFAVAQYCLSCQGWPWRRSLPWGIWLGLWWWRRAQLWPSAALGPPWLASHAASSRHPNSGEVRDGSGFKECYILKDF